jgi:DNA-binding MarR family transcriptional regulator
MHTVFQVIAAARSLEKAAARVFKPHGLTPARFNVLNLLSEEPAGMRASDLASALIVDPSNVTGLLKRMKKEGLLTEMENASDRRQYIVGLSAKGRRAWRDAHRDYERCLAALIGRLTGAECAAADRVLQTLIEEAANIP